MAEGAAPIPAAMTVRNLRVTARVDASTIVREVSLDLAPGELLGVVGESGAGKTALALALLAAARPGTRVAAGSVALEGVDLLEARGSARQRILGRQIAFVPQDPGGALNPATSIGTQLREVLKAHSWPSGDVDGRVSEILSAVLLPADRTFRRRYPHQLSGGQQQRVAIALALACEPAVVVFDEPTTNLDVTTQAEILELIASLREQRSVSMVYVTHNLAVIRKIADRVAVMYGGTVVESGPTEEIFRSPRHPYTWKLLAAVASLAQGRAPLEPRVGPAVSVVPPIGCSYAGRCEHRQSACDVWETDEEVSPGHTVRCARWRRLRPAGGAIRGAKFPARAAGTELLRALDVVAEYRLGRGHYVRAVDGVSLELAQSQCLAVVGESGSGKSTLARCIMGLHPRWEGTVELAGRPLARSVEEREREELRKLQIVFQNPDRSLNPLQTVAEIVGRPARRLLGLTRREAYSRAGDMLEAVRLPRSFLGRRPTAMSGGQRQRVAIARALAADPEVIVCDEITSALDVSVQASLIELLGELRAVRGLSILFISHDLAVVRMLADQVVVMQNGRVCEAREAGALFEAPRNPYTRALLAASEFTIGPSVAGT